MGTFEAGDESALAGRGGTPETGAHFALSGRLPGKVTGTELPQAPFPPKDSSAPTNLSLWRQLVLGLQKLCGEFRFHSGSKKSRHTS